MDLKLTSKNDSYKTDLSKIRDRIRQNGTLEKIEWITIKSPRTDKKVALALNIAFEPNNNKTAPDGSLYVFGFSAVNLLGEIHHPYFFSIADRDVGVANSGQRLPKINGSYTSLGYPHTLPIITEANLIDSIENLAKYRGEVNQLVNVKMGLARLIIALSEAIRFCEVKEGVNSVLAAKDNTYTPNSTLIHNWGGHKICNS